MSVHFVGKPSAERRTVAGGVTPSKERDYQPRKHTAAVMNELTELHKLIEDEPRKHGKKNKDSVQTHPHS